MSIWRGDVKIGDVYYGNRKILRAYAGNNLVYSSLSGKLWKNFVSGQYYIIDGKLFYHNGTGYTQVGNFDDWKDVGLRANGTLWRLSGSTAVQVGEETDWQDVRGIYAIRQGKLYNFNSGSASQVGNKEWVKLFNSRFGMTSDGKLANTLNGETQTNIVGNWSMGTTGSYFANAIYAICDGTLYPYNSVTPVLAGTWTAIDGLASYRHTSSSFNYGWTYSIGIFNGKLCGVGYNGSNHFVIEINDEPGWTAVSGLYGVNYNNTIQAYAYALKGGNLYAVGYENSLPTLTMIGTDDDWAGVLGYSSSVSSNITECAYAVKQGKQYLYRLKGNTVTKIE